MTQQPSSQPNSKPTLCESDLAGFCGSAEAYRHWTKRLIYTEGVKFMAERAEAYWLIDAIASYQPDKRIASRPDIVAFQLWELAVTEDNKAVLTMRGDSDQPAIITQEIPFTDFPLKHIKFYVCNNTLMLPSEY